MIMSMTNIEIKQRLQKLFLKYYDKGVREFTVEYNGSGDSYEDSWCNENIDYQDYEDILFHIIELSDVDFNNDGGGGKILFDLKNLKIKYSSYYNEIVQHNLANDELSLKDETNNIKT